MIKENRFFTTGRLALFVALMVVLIDQVLKFWVKLNFYWGEELEIFSWFKLNFVQNPGMAFGWTIGSKFFLTLFRIVFVACVIFAVVKLRNAKLKKGFIICVALIIAGAIGNIIDCLFYGLIFNNPYPPEVASLFPPVGGYAPLFHGMVVDMFHFPLFHFYWPDWVPFVGGEYFEFFSPVFNVADAAISVGVICVILFYSKQMNDSFVLLKESLKRQPLNDDTPNENKD